METCCFCMRHGLNFVLYTVKIKCSLEAVKLFTVRGHKDEFVYPNVIILNLFYYIVLP
jgi:hypothetical protein